MLDVPLFSQNKTLTNLTRLPRQRLEYMIMCLCRDHYASVSGRRQSAVDRGLSNRYINVVTSYNCACAASGKIIRKQLYQKLNNERDKRLKANTYKMDDEFWSERAVQPVHRTYTRCVLQNHLFFRPASLRPTKGAPM